MLKNTLALLLLFSCIVSFAQTSLEEKVKKMMDISGGSDLVYNGLKQAVNSQKSYYSDLSEEEWNELQESLIDSLQKVLQKHTISDYTEYFTEADIDQIITFYTSEVGKKLRLHQDSILTRSLRTSMELASNIKKLVYERYQEKLKTKFNSISTGCECAKVGKFTIQFTGSDPEDAEYLIERSKTKQIEFFENYRTTFKIRWIKDCAYTLEIKESNNPEVNLETNGPSSEVRVFECNDVDEFEFIIYLKKHNVYVSGKGRRL